jgi:hypothetical protein
VSCNRGEGRGQNTKLQWETEFKIAKVTNILRLTDTDFTRNMKGKQIFHYFRVSTQVF